LFPPIDETIRRYIEEQKTHADPDLTLQAKVLAAPETERILRDALLVPRRSTTDSCGTCAKNTRKPEKQK
jgi:hypothetical protein